MLKSGRGQGDGFFGRFDQLHAFLFFGDGADPGEAEFPGRATEKFVRLRLREGFGVKSIQEYHHSGA